MGHQVAKISRLDKLARFVRLYQQGVVCLVGDVLYGGLNLGGLPEGHATNVTLRGLTAIHLVLT
jgi:hypothetical protein